MKRLSILAVLVFLPAFARADVLWHSHDFHPNTKFEPLPNLADAQPGGVYQVGEVAILEGDYGLVSYGSTGFGIVLNQSTQNHYSISKRFLGKYADDFDELIIFTTFEDNWASGAAAYEMSVQQDVLGNGEQLLDDSLAWGSTSKRLHAFVNMMRWDKWDSEGSPITDPTNFFYPVLGQEWAHRWLAFVRYKDAKGANSAAMLGRDAAHWASTLEASGSVMDGSKIEPQADGSFLITDYMSTYSPLDLYIMGLVPASSVSPWFRVADAKDETGAPVDVTQGIAIGSRITGTRENITIDQVIQALGPRMPDAALAPHAFRAAFVLITAPGQKASEAIAPARTLDQVRKIWEQKFSEYTRGAGTVCTQLLAPCGAPMADVVDGVISEAGGNGNGVVEPGEPITVRFTVENGGMSAASNISVSATGTAITGAPAQTVANLAPGATETVTFNGTVPSDAKCGEPLTVGAQATLGSTAYPGLATVVPGRTQALFQSFEDSDGGFTVEPGSTKNGWEYGAPIEYKHTTGFVYQPNGGHSASQKAWFTGLTPGHRAQFDSSLGVGGSVLYSPVYDLTKVRQPTLRYYVWYQGIDYTNPMAPANTVGAKLAIDASIDDGATFIPLDKADTTQSTWDEHRISLNTPQYRDAKKIQLRFTVINPQPTYQVEAGIDDFEIVGLTTACAEGEGGGCSVGPNRSTPAGAAVALVALALLTLAIRTRRRT
jgi:hypothetical protein